MIVTELINRAYSMSQIVARSLESVNGEQGRDGLFLINQLLASKAATGDEIPYYENITTSITSSEDSIFVDRLISFDALTFTIGTVRYPITLRGRRRFWGGTRVNGIKSLPFTWYWQREPGGMRIFAYFSPNQTYVVDISGQRAFDSVTADQELDTTMDPFYQNFLMFDLAAYLCMWNGISCPPDVSDELKLLKKRIYRINPPDYTAKRISTFKQCDSLNYASVNLGQGWVVPG